MEMFSCDPKSCSQCNPKVAKALKNAQDIEEKIEANDGPKKLEVLLSTLDKFTIRGTTFRIARYIRRGYYIKKTVNITFIRDNFHGILKDSNEDILIYHNGTIDFTDQEFPQLCPYIFLNKSKNGIKEPDIDAITHVKILFSDTIFEDYVHVGNGVIIENNDILNINKNIN